MRIRFLPLVLLFACGDNDNGHTHPDAGSTPDASPDASVPLTCAYTEMADGMNDDLFGNGMPEETMLSFTGSPTMICGKFDNTHFQQGQGRVDVDSYVLTVPADSKGILSLTGAGAEGLTSVFIEIYGLSSMTSETGQFIGNYAVTSADLPAGDYVVTVQAYNATAPTASLDYKLVLQTDSATRCAKSTAPADYTEAHDGVTADGNDVVEVRYSGQPRRQLTANALDAAEPTGLTIAPGASFHVTGTNTKPAVTPVSWADSFQDRDTYLITMGANANELSVRLNWPGLTTDFDVFVFPANGVNEQATGWYNRNVEDEFTTLAVTPGSQYWVWVGADDQSTGQPINYDLTLCGATFTQPQ